MKKNGRPKGSCQKKFTFYFDSIGKSYSQLAKEIGISESTVRHWERYGVPENRLDKFCLAAGSVRWTGSVLERISNVG